MELFFQELLNKRLFGEESIRGTVSSCCRVLYPMTFVVIACVGGLGTFGKLSLLHVRLPALGLFVRMLGLLWTLSPLAFRLALRLRLVLAPLVVIALLAAPLLIFPKVEKLHATGRGSDQPDCVIVASRDMMSGLWPYDSSQMWSHNPLSCGPGWVGLQAPVVQSAGYPQDLFLISLLCLSAMLITCGWNQFSGFLSLLALAPGFWVAAADGTDFVPFGLIVTSLAASAARSKATKRGVVVLLALISQFRIVTVILPAFLSRLTGKTGACIATGIAVGTEATFLLYNPHKFIHDGPMHLFAKATGWEIPNAPALLALGFTFASVAAVSLVLRLRENSLEGHLLLTYVLAIFAVPALFNLISECERYGMTMNALGFWEGANWLAGCLPLATFLLVRNIDREPAVGSAPRSELITAEAANT